jgi:predicted TIM-barrel fold metal-dependent hydrolase
MVSGPLADAHFHLFSRGMPSTRGDRILGDASEIAVYESYRKAFGIAAGLAIGYEADGIDPHNNQYIRSLAAERPWLATVAYAAPAPALQPASASGFLDDGHAGIAIYVPDAAVGASITAWPTETWRLLGARRAIVSLNARNPAIAALAPLVEREASCTFLFSHLGLPGRFSLRPTIAQAAERLEPLLRFADMPHVFVKISGLYAVSDPAHGYPHDAAAPFVDVLLSRFGPSRCLWASDFSPALEYVSFAQTVSNPWLGHLTTEERDQVMGGNLLRLLGIEVAANERVVGVVVLL